MNGPPLPRRSGALAASMGFLIRAGDWRNSNWKNVSLCHSKEIFLMD